MSKSTSLAVLVAAAVSLFTIAQAQAGEAPTHRHGAKAAAARHASIRAARHSYARMPAEDEAPSPPVMVSPNLYETGHAPGQPGPMH